MASFVELERSLYLAHVHAQGMFVELCTSCLPRHGLYLRHLQQKSFGTCSYGVALLK